MGLDIAAFQFATRLDPQPAEHYEWLWDLDEIQRVYVDKAFGHALAGTPVEASVRFGLDAGWFMTGGKTKRFRAGSYGGYGSFRDALSLAATGLDSKTIWANPDSHTALPFFELLHFSDCDGCMSGTVAALLAADFVEQRETVLPKWNPDDPTQAWFREKYDDWQEAFALAAERGLVVFH